MVIREALFWLRCAFFLVSTIVGFLILATIGVILVLSPYICVVAGVYLIVTRCG